MVVLAVVSASSVTVVVVAAASEEGEEGGGVAGGGDAISARREVSERSLKWPRCDWISGISVATEVSEGSGSGQGARESVRSFGVDIVGVVGLLSPG